MSESKACPILTIAKAIINAYREKDNDDLGTNNCILGKCAVWDDSRDACGLRNPPRVIRPVSGDPRRGPEIPF